MYTLRHRAVLALLAALVLTPSLVSAAGPPSSVGNAVTDWNTIATAAVLVDPGRVRDSGTMAAVHAAIHDAVNAVDQRYHAYSPDCC